MFSIEPIRVFVVDIDGCLTPGGPRPFYLPALVYLREVNELAERFAAVPDTTFLTGRPQAYMEAMLQVIHGRLPGLCENGALMFRVSDRLELFHPALPENAPELLARLSDEVRRHLLEPGDVIEFGKAASLAVVPGRPRRSRDLLDRARELAAPWGDEFEVTDSSSILHILFRKVSKGSGVSWLSEELGVPLASMAGIGDAVLDVPFLRLVGFSAAPATAPEYVREAVTFRPVGGPGHCVVETLDAIIRQNLGLGGGLAEGRRELEATLRELHRSIFGADGLGYGGGSGAGGG